jgi:hypothetical protein
LHACLVVGIRPGSNPVNPASPDSMKNINYNLNGVR